MNAEEKRLVALFAAEWERTEGYKPASFQKVIALQRIKRGHQPEKLSAR